MLDANSLFQKIITAGILAKIPHGSVENAMRVVTALFKGGVRMIEVDIRSSQGIQIVEQSASRFANRLIISADFVLDPHAARKAILAGADLISTPYLIKDVVKTCNRYAKTCIPGALTVTEVLKTLETGATLIKLYPADQFGPGLLKAIKGPLPQANLIPSAGVNLDNMAAWLRAGACAVAIDGTFGNSAEDYTNASDKAITEQARKITQCFADNTA